MAFTDEQLDELAKQGIQRVHFTEEQLRESYLFTEERLRELEWANERVLFTEEQMRESYLLTEERLREAEWANEGIQSDGDDTSPVVDSSEHLKVEERPLLLLDIKFEEVEEVEEVLYPYEPLKMEDYSPMTIEEIIGNYSPLRVISLEVEEAEEESCKMEDYSQEDTMNNAV